MKRKRDANGKFVKMYLTREEYEAKVAELEKTVDTMCAHAQAYRNEAAFWKQEHDRVMRLYIGQEIQFKQMAAMRNWLYERAGWLTKLRYHKAKENGEL